MDAVPAHLSWRLGYTYVQPLLTALPGHQTTFDQDLKAALHQVYAGGGTVPSLLGESYANFGPPGWLVVPLLLGFLLAWLYRSALARNDPAWWALYAYAIVAVLNANLSGLSVASVFPLIGTIVLAFAAAGLPVLLSAIQRLR
jgi:oligosaccharide repeat unit polymerase